MFGKKQKSTDGVTKALVDLERQIELKDLKIQNLQNKCEYLLEKNKELETLIEKYNIIYTRQQ